MNNRRKLVIAVVAGAVTVPLVVKAQQTAKLRTIGFLSPYSASFLRKNLTAFRQGLADLGYVLGKNVVIEERHYEGRLEKIGALIAELTRFPLDVLVTHGSSAADHARQTSSSIPIVFIAHPDPLGTGTVASLSRPGGNVTGLSDLHGDLTAKRLELLKETVPSVSRIGVLWDPANPSQRLQLKETQAAAKVLGVAIIPIEIRGPEDWERVSTAIKGERIDALNRLGGTGGIHRKQLAALALRHRMPSIVTGASAAEDGFLMSYGSDHSDLYRRAATYVDKIFKGAKPADLPVEQPTKFELVINMKTAKALGFTIPPVVMMRADRVIE